MLGKREEAVAKLLEQVFNSVLQAQATEQLNADPYERSDELPHPLTAQTIVVHHHTSSVPPFGTELTTQAGFTS